MKLQEVLMNMGVPLRERVLAAAAASPSLTRRQGRRIAVLGVALSVLVAAVLWVALGEPSAGGVRVAEGWTIAAGAITWLVVARGRSTLARSPSLLRAATWASPIVLVLWLRRFEDAAAAPAGIAACVLLALALAATPLLTFLFLRRGAAPHCPATLGGAAGAMCGAWAQVLVLAGHPAPDLVHAVLAHALPQAALAALGTIAGRGVLGMAAAATTMREPVPRRSGLIFSLTSLLLLGVVLTAAAAVACGGPD
jgi:hypothetical protein